MFTPQFKKPELKKTGVAALAAVIALGLAPLAPLAPAHAEETTGSTSIHFSRQPIAHSTYSKSATMRLSVQAEDTGGQVLAYQWKWSPSDKLSEAQPVVGIDGSDTQSVLTVTTPSTPGTYHYWVEITAGDQTAHSDSAEVVVVDRTLEKELTNGDFQEFGGQLDNPWQTGAWVYAAADIRFRWNLAKLKPGEGLSQHYADLGEYLPHWNTTHYASGAYQKVVELQNPTTVYSNVSGSGLQTEGHADDARTDAEKEYTAHVPLIAELSAEARSSIYQDIATVPGKVYEWSLDHASEYAGGAMNYMDALAVIIGPAINTPSDYGQGVTARWQETGVWASNNDAIGSMSGSAPSGSYPYGLDTNTLFQDVLVKTAIDQGIAGATDADKVKALKERSGEYFTTEYNGGKYYVYISADPYSDPNWVHRSGSYSVPKGQGTTVFGFVSVDSSKGQAGNLLDNIIFKSGSVPGNAQEVSYTGDSALTAETEDGYAYALAELRGSTVYPLQERSVWFTPTSGSELHASVNVTLGDGESWYTPGAGKLSFQDLVPGKTYRLIGIPAETVSAELGTNVSPADVMDEGYYADSTIKAGKDDLSDGVAPNISASLYKSGEQYLGRIFLSATDSRSEYALLTRDSDNAWVPVAADGAALTVSAAASDANWVAGTGVGVAFTGLTPGREYRLIARPAGYSELTWQTVAANEDSGVVKITVPAVGADVDADKVQRTSDDDSDTLVLAGVDDDVTYHVLDAATGKQLTQKSGSTSYTIDLGNATQGLTLQVVAEIAGAFTQGVRVYPYPAYKGQALTIDYVKETIGVGSGVLPTGMQFRIDYEDKNLLTNTSTADGYLTAVGSQRIRLGVDTSYLDGPLLDTIAVGKTATLKYRFSATAGYEGAYYAPVSELVIPSRPAASEDPPGIDWVAETVNSKPFAELGYDGFTDIDVPLRMPAVAGEKFTSMPTDITLPKRSGGPIGLFGTYAGVLTVAHFDPAKSYEKSTDQVTWTKVESISESGTAVLGDESLYYVRFAADPEGKKPASWPVAVSDSPLDLDVAEIEFGFIDYGAAPPAPSKVTIQNVGGTSTAATLQPGTRAEIVDTTRDGQPFDGQAFTLSVETGDLPELAPWGEDGSSDDSLYAVSVNDGLLAGRYTAILLLHYRRVGSDDDVTTQATLRFAVNKVTWELGTLEDSLDVPGNGIDVTVTSGVPEGAAVEYALSPEEGQWQDTGLFTDLEWAMEYEIWVRAKADASHNASKAKLLEQSVFTDQPTVEATDVVRVNYAAETLEFLAGVQPANFTVQVGDKTVSANSSLTQLADSGGGQVSVRRAGSSDARVAPGPGLPDVLNVPARPAAPDPAKLTTTPAASNANPTGKITNVDNATFEYRTAGSNSAWIVANGGQATGVASGGYEVRFPVQAAAFASAVGNVNVGAEKTVYQVFWSPSADVVGDYPANPAVAVTAIDTTSGQPVAQGGQVELGHVVRFQASTPGFSGWVMWHWTSADKDLDATHVADGSTPWEEPVVAEQDLTVTSSERVILSIGGYYKRLVAYRPNGADGSVPATRNTAEDPDYSVVIADGTGFTRQGFGFMGWNTAADGSGTAYAPGDSFTMTQTSAVLYAQWASSEASLNELDGHEIDPASGDGSKDSPYQVAVDVDASQVTLGTEHLVLSDGATAQMSLGDFGPGTSVELAQGADTKVYIQVTATAGNSEYYVVTVWRPAETSTLKTLVDNMARLKELGLFEGYTKASVKSLQTALDAAEDLLDSSKPTQQAIDDARADILAAVDNLRDRGDYPATDPMDDLTALVAVASAPDKSQYEANSYQAFETALAQAQEVLANPSPTDDEVKAARDNLVAAMAGLKLHYTAEIAVQVSQVNVAKKKTFQLAGLAYLEYGAVEELVYKSSDESVAQVSATGKITGKAVGTATITASSATPGADGFAVTAEIQVNVVSKSASVKSVTADIPKDLAPSQIMFIHAAWSKDTATPGKVTFSSSNKKIATVDKAGKVTAVGSGTVKIKVKAGSKSKSYSVRVAKLTSAKPVITGGKLVGETVTAVPGVWSPAGVALEYQWLRSGKAISGATEATYTLQGADVGKKITVKVTGSKDGYPKVSATSSKYVKPGKGQFSAPIPTLSGEAKVGQTLSADAGVWTPVPEQLTYQWYRDSAKIPGATGATYTVADADLGKALRVQIKGSSAGYTTLELSSARTAAVVAG
ncbi:MAG: FIVAR domain-containing protein [Propionibacteriaceae bacterium]|jgi:hypothetical protein|nr:FIVAR domain-containing protein [Propionibacteriaceae bacterium]